mmetsp:Transcript_5166/g.15759  ORF Transcript_5166/g.15759 Transcript_5166/m.15759 type:complete len:250 (-) Transcript_5166:87-836(-)
MGRPRVPQQKRPRGHRDPAGPSNGGGVHPPTGRRLERVELDQLPLHRLPKLVRPWVAHHGVVVLGVAARPHYGGRRVLRARRSHVEDALHNGPREPGVVVLIAMQPLGVLVHLRKLKPLPHDVVQAGAQSTRFDSVEGRKRRPHRWVQPAAPRKAAVRQPAVGCKSAPRRPDVVIVLAGPRLDPPGAFDRGQRRGLHRDGLGGLAVDQLEEIAPPQRLHLGALGGWQNVGHHCHAVRGQRGPKDVGSIG